MEKYIKLMIETLGLPEDAKVEPVLFDGPRYKFVARVNEEKLCYLYYAKEEDQTVAIVDVYDYNETKKKLIDPLIGE